MNGKEEEIKVGIDKQTNKIIIKVNPKYYRPNEVENLRKPIESKKRFKWKPKVTFKELVKEMIEYELNLQS